MSLLITSILFNLMEGTVYLVHTFGIIDCACQWCMCTRMHGYFVLLFLGIVMRSAEPTIMISLVEGSDAIVYVISVWSMELSCQSFHCSTFSNPNPNLPALRS